MRRALLLLASAAWTATTIAGPPEVPKPAVVAATPANGAEQATAVDATKPVKPAKAAPGKTIDRVELDQTTITGNRELPNVMVIVPWKESSPGSVSPASRSLLEEALAPLDREEFRRELQDREALQPTPTPSPTTPPN